MSILDNIKEVINHIVDNGVVSFGAVIATKDGKEAIRYSYGYQDIENDIPYSDNTILRMFSCTKTFTAVAVFKCIELGLFKLDDPISKYFPSFKNPVVNKDGKEVSSKREIIIKDLLDMKAGLSYPEWGTAAGEYAIKIDEELSNNKLTTLEYADKVGKSPLLFNPGEDYKYSTCADILGALIIKTSGLSLSEFFNKYIFKPLGLKDAGFTVGKNNKNRIAKGYLTKDNKLEPVLHPTIGINAYGDDNPFESGGAGLFMTLDDLNRYALCLLNKTEGILSEDSYHKMLDSKYSPNSSKIQDDYIYYNLMRHKFNACEFGWDGALGTFIMVDPINKITLVMGFQRKKEKESIKNYFKEREE